MMKKYLYTNLSELDDMDPGSVHSGRLSSDLFNGGPMDPDMGHVPLVPPGTPPMDNWGPYGAMHPNPAFMERHSPNIPMVSGHPMPMDGMPMMGPMMARMMNHDMNDNSRGYSDYGPNSNQNHVEVY